MARGRERVLFHCVSACISVLAVLILIICVTVVRQPELPILLYTSVTKELLDTQTKKPTFSLTENDQIKLRTSYNTCSITKPETPLPLLHGVWHEVRDQETYMDDRIYGAYFDERGHVIRLFGVSTTPKESLPYCYFWYQGLLYPIVTSVSGVNVVDTGRGYSHQGMKFQERLYNCELPDIQAIPEHITLSFAKCQVPQNFIPIHVTGGDSLSTESLRLCVPVSFGDLNPYELLEWVEFNKILGISGIDIYNSSIEGRANKVIQFYVDEGYISVQNVAPPMTDQCWWCHKLSTIPVLNDCLYRNRNRYRYLMVTDLDELIIPTSHDTIPSMLESLEGISKLQQPAFMFQNAYFFRDFKPQEDRESSSNLLTIRYLLRMSPSAEGYAAKSVINPEQCIVLQNHFCMMRTPEVGVYWTSTVDPEVALCHHYKFCHFSSDVCRKSKLDQHLDTSVWRFRENLVRNIEKTQALLGM